MIVEHFRFDETEAKNGHASYLEEKTLFCDLLKSERPANAFTQARQSQLISSKDPTPIIPKLSLSFRKNSLKTTSLVM